MPWVWDNGGRSNSRRRSRTRVNGYTRRSYRNGGYDNGDEYDNTRRSTGDDDGFRLYDRDGTPVRIEVQSPSDMLPPRHRATELTNGNLMRSRARF